MADSCKNNVDVKNIQSTLSTTETFGTGPKCPSYKESNKMSKERQGPTLSVRFTEVSVKRESTVVKIPISEKKNLLKLINNDCT